jgi:hypothetical protein
MLTYDDLTSKTNKYIIPSLIDTIYKSSPVLTRFRTRNMERFEGGITIRQPIMYAALKGGAFARGSSFDTSYVQTDTALEINVKYYYVNATLFGTDNVLNRGPEAAMSYVESKMVNASGRMAQLLATDFYLDGQGTASQPIALDGFAAAIDDGSNYATYGGITRADLATGPNQGINAYYNGSNTTFALSQLQTAYGASWFGAEHVDLIATTQPLWDSIWSKIQPQQRFLEESSDVAKIGFQSLRFNGSSIVVDQYAPAGKIWGLNTAYIQFWMSTLPLFQFGFTGWKEAQNSIDVSGQYVFGGNLLVTAPRLMFQLANYTS